MKLSIKDRLIIQGILMPNMPAKGTYVEMLHLNDLKSQMQITIDEAQQYNFRDTDGNIAWDNSPNADKEVTLSPFQIDFLQLAVMALDEAKKIDVDIFPTCQKIMDLNN